MPKTIALSRCTGEVRWVPLSSMQAHRHRLQQAWEVTDYKDGKAAGVRIEWRDVPHVDNPQ